MMVSLFPQIKATTGGEKLPLVEVLAGIMSGLWRAQVEAVRAEQPGSGAYDMAKRALPYFTPSGTFERRAVGGLVQHSGFMSLDLDAKPNPDTDWAQVRAAIEADEHTYACFLSTGGVGLCVLVPVPTTHHLGSFRALEVYYAEHFGVKIDQSCKDVSRARFVSYDPKLFLNEQAETFAELVEPKAATIPARQPQPVATTDLRSTDTEDRLIAIGVKMIREAQDGGKYVQVRNAGHLVGGYVGSGFVEAGRAFDALYSALLAKENVADPKAAEKALRSGLEVSGPARPLLPDWLQYKVRQELREHKGNPGAVVTIAHREAAAAHVAPAGVQAAVEAIAAEQAQEVELLTFWGLVDGPKRDGPKRLLLSLDKFIAWLGTEGFRKYRSAAGGYATVRVVAGVVSEIDRGQLFDHVLGYLAGLPFEFDGVYGFQVRELVLAQERKLLDANFLQALPTLDEDWLRDGPSQAYYFFRNCWVTVTATGIATAEYGSLPGQIWAEQVRAHDFVLLASAEAALQADFHQFTVNVSGGNADRLALLRASLGYLLHGYKEEQNAKCVIFVDEVATTGKPDGRTGKSLLIKAVGELVQVTTIAGATFRFEDSFRFQRISAATRLAYFDEWDGRRLPFKKLFTEITSEIAVNRKNHAEFTIPFADSPKFAITTNDVVSGEGGSHEGRKIEIPLAPHYSARHTPKDDFGVGFFKEGWDTAEYNRFFNLALGWVQQFLSGGRQLTQLASAALDARKLEDSTSPEFLEFARTELAELQGRGHTIWAEQAYKDYLTFAGESDRRFPMRRFYHWMAKLGFERKRWKHIGADRDKSYFEKPEASSE
ncbi:hypothetical protein FNT36_03150 [Hymenobacter setariae]|uniref:BT4734-like N-terminal domain-containing protein n=1 Tax=Hymenobacter setariae TaxID=2594794 RepID=A0A558C2T2_9BACT|nr:BT4734/BF3469 family protein [Hymenobacter setariae]TVT43103.1 hypothetical protein FNT36_03150 [Hymenobacter setariae]